MSETNHCSSDDFSNNKFLLNEQQLDDVLDSNFLDPGVSNGDVDWLFRGREVKKLTKRSNPINNEVQSQLIHAQQKALVQQKGKDPSSTTSSSTTSLNLNFQEDSNRSEISANILNSVLNPNSSSGSPILNAVSSSPKTSSIPIMTRSRKSSSASDFPLKSSLKSSSPSTTLKIDTSLNFLNSHDQSSMNFLLNSNKSTTCEASPTVTSPQTNASTPQTPQQHTPRSRSSSLHFTRPKSNSTASEIVKPKKSFISALSSKLKPSSASSNQLLSPQQPATATSLPNSTKSLSASQKNPTTSPVVAKNPLSTRAHAATILSKQAEITKNIPQTASGKPLSHQKQEQTSQSLEATDESLNKTSFKRVCFALNDLAEDPQQQIPSRRPKKGNVLIPEDMLAPPPKLSIGITNSFNQQTKDEKPQVDPNLYAQAVARQNFFLAESKKHSEEAHVAALRIAKEVSAFKKKRKNSFLKSNDETDSEEEEADITDSRFLHGNGDDVLDIDTPIHTHVDYFGDSNDTSEAKENADAMESKEISMETLYTRCCHLREILPIPATLKQLKDKSKPLHVLKMLNPKPTLIDILSFSDFLAIAPIITVIFDNVTIDTEMLKIILVSLKNSKMLDKLSLRNVPIDAEGWKFLCKFLRMNPNIQKLDISQQKVKKNSDNSKTTIRSDLDWDLFINTLILRGGIEELVIHGCCLNNDQFSKLVNNALVLKTKRFGLASSQLDLEKMTVLSKWISDPKTTCIGIDYAFNDLSNGKLSPINRVLKENSSNIQLQFFSLNSTNVTLDECTELIKHLSDVKSLRFLDLSNNSHLFPEILPILREYLPKFSDLRRIHFDFDKLSEVIIVQLCTIFQECTGLVHVSFLGNERLTAKSALALYSAVKNSHIYNIDMDYDGLDEELVSRIAFYLMRNMESFLNKNNGVKTKSRPMDNDIKSDLASIFSGHNVAVDEDLIFDGSLLTKAAEHLLENDSKITGEERVIIHRSLVEKTTKLRKEIHDSMNNLFRAREKGKLSIEGKENLLRFCLLDDSLENILDIFSDEVDNSNQNKNNGENTASDVVNSNIGFSNHLDASNDALRPSLVTRPSLIRKLSSQLTRHQSSDDVMRTGPIIGGELYQHTEDPVQPIATEAPHIVVADADSVPVDSTTGQRVLMRRFSQTNVHSKKLEEEEGELHRWGFFVQQQNDIMPDDSQNISEKEKEKEKDLEKEKEKELERLRIQAEEKAKQEEAERLKIEHEKKVLKINTIPSGSELRETIMKAKGIESITDLIRKVNKDFTTMENIYKHADTKRPKEPADKSDLTNIKTENLNEAAPKLSSPAAKHSTATPIAANKATLSVGSSLTRHSNEGVDNSVATVSEQLSDCTIQEKSIPHADQDGMGDTVLDGSVSPSVSISSLNDGGNIEDADEVYERILSNVIRVRSNKVD